MDAEAAGKERGRSLQQSKGQREYRSAPYTRGTGTQKQSWMIGNGRRRVRMYVRLTENEHTVYDIRCGATPRVATAPPLPADGECAGGARIGDRVRRSQGARARLCTKATKKYDSTGRELRNPPPLQRDADKLCLEVQIGRISGPRHQRLPNLRGPQAQAPQLQLPTTERRLLIRNIAPTARDALTDVGPRRDLQQAPNGRRRLCSHLIQGT